MGFNGLCYQIAGQERGNHAELVSKGGAYCKLLAAEAAWDNDAQKKWWGSEGFDETMNM